MKLQNCLIGMLCLFLNTHAQIKPLSVGELVPGITIQNIYNYPASQFTLAAFDNRLLILDFMATNCSSCIKALPSLQALQKKYGDKIKVLLVTSQSPQKVKTFLHSHAEIKLPMVSGDTLLSKMFPHTFISHEVWIKDGIVKAITHPEYVNEKNINAFLSGSSIHLPVKNDQGTCKKYSVISLYLYAYGLSWYPAKRIVLEVKDSSRFFYNKSYGYKEEWKQNNSFCLQSLLHDAVSMQAIKSRLDSCFSLHGRIEKREMQCLVLKQSKAITANSITGSTRDISKTALLYALEQTYMPVIDETTGSVTHTTVNENYLSDIPLLKQTVTAYGLELVTEIREIEVLIISDNIINQKK